MQPRGSAWARGRAMPLAPDLMAMALAPWLWVIIQDVARDAVAVLEQKANEILDATCKNVLDKCIAPMEQWLHSLEVQLNTYMTFLSTTRNDIRKELEQ